MSGELSCPDVTFTKIVWDETWENIKSLAICQCEIERLKLELEEINKYIPDQAKLACEGHMPSAVKWMAKKLRGDEDETEIDSSFEDSDY